jgi:hypothetical protein
VISRACPRCHTVLGHEEEGTLLFCWNCGAPQVMVSEELTLQAEQQRRALETGTLTGEPQPNGASADGVVWPGAIHCAALTGGIAAALTLLSFAFAPLVLLAWFWAVGAPVVALGLYSARFRQTRIVPSFGARLGLLCGLAIFFSMTTVNTAGLLLARFAFHSAAQIDGQLATFFAQVRTTIQAQGGPAQAEALAWLAKPEDRLGLLLAMSGVVLAMYLGLSAAGGAFAALLRSRSDSREQLR